MRSAPAATLTVKDTEVKIAQVESNLRRDIKELELKMASGQTTLEKGQSDTQKQMLQIGIGLALFIIAGVSFVLRLFGHP